MDLHRVFIGDDGLVFLVEVVFRTAILYVYTFSLVRIAARRTVGQLSLAELLLVVALGSAVGDPMFYADVPVLHGMTVITVVVGLEMALGALIARSARLERMVEGAPARAVRGGRLDMEGIAAREIGREELFQRLRARGIEQLGQVRAAYLEQDGVLSVFRYPPGQELRGLPIEPPEFIRPLPGFRAGTSAAEDGDYSCTRCGYSRHFERGERFSEHEEGHEHWTRAVGPDGAPLAT